MHNIKHYFTELTEQQFSKLEMLNSLYRFWNTKINLISRKDFDNFYINHVLHSMSLLKYFSFLKNTSFLDVGTGGGFPGIPLAICLPDCTFTLNDSIGKKMKVVDDIVKQLDLKNVVCETGRAEDIKKSFDFITGRAVTALPPFVGLIRKKISPVNKNAFANGILYLKGGDFEDELKTLNMKHDVYNLKDHFSEEFFETKKLVYLW